jgi:hypothetical protein
LQQEHRTPEHSPSPTPAPVNMSPDWERSALFEKMVRVQRDNARKSEKLDFLEEHVQDLLAEVKKKNRIIQFFFAKEDSGSMATEASDRHKVIGHFSYKFLYSPFDLIIFTNKKDTIEIVDHKFSCFSIPFFIYLLRFQDMKLMYQVKCLKNNFDSFYSSGIF